MGRVLTSPAPDNGDKKVRLFDSPLRSDPLFWVCFAGALVLCSWGWLHGSLSVISLVPAWVPGWFVIPIASVFVTWVLGAVLGSVRIFFRELHRHSDAPDR
jgi:hypothetical protein